MSTTLSSYKVRNLQTYTENSNVLSLVVLHVSEELVLLLVYVLNHDFLVSAIVMMLYGACFLPVLAVAATASVLAASTTSTASEFRGFRPGLVSIFGVVLLMLLVVLLPATAFKVPSASASAVLPTGLVRSVFMSGLSFGLSRRVWSARRSILFFSWCCLHGVCEKVN